MAREDAIYEIKTILNQFSRTIADKQEAIRIRALGLYLDEPLKKEKGVKGDKPKTERGKHMSKCMTGKDKGGEGKNMSECSVEWKKIKVGVK